MRVNDKITGRHTANGSCIYGAEQGWRSAGLAVPPFIEAHVVAQQPMSRLQSAEAMKLLSHSSKSCGLIAPNRSRVLGKYDKAKVGRGEAIKSCGCETAKNRPADTPTAALRIDHKMADPPAIGIVPQAVKFGVTKDLERIEFPHRRGLAIDVGSPPGVAPIANFLGSKGRQSTGGQPEELSVVVYP